MKIISIIILMALFSSCGSFLDEVDKDQLIPSKTEHYATVLLNCIRYDYPLFVNIDYMTDNLIEYDGIIEKSRKEKKPIYTWQMEIEKDEKGKKVGGNEAWKTCYKNIAIANYVLELIDESEGKPEEKASVKGEAYFIRALCYFNLLNLYGAPFNKETAEMALGIPLRLDNGIEQVYNRNTVAECYRQIETELAEASRLIKESGITKSKYHPSVGACELLLSRVCLYQEKWAEAITAATNAMKYGVLSQVPNQGLFINIERTELIYTGNLRPLLITSAFDKGWQVNPELIRLYDETKDARLTCFFNKVEGSAGSKYYANKQERSFSSAGVCNFRIAEAYLNRAEAYLALGDINNAVLDMKELLETRYTSPDAFNVPEEKDILEKFILDERRKELCFEEHHRWFDLRRMKAENRQDIVHYFTLTDDYGAVQGIQKYTLFSDDLNYTLPIPLEERENNPLIINNERYEKIPETNSEVIIP